MLKKLKISKFIMSYLLILTGLSIIGIKRISELKNDYLYLNYNDFRRNFSQSLNRNIDKAQFIDYVAYLKIPKINLNKGLLDKESVLNVVDKNIQIIKESDMPDIVNSNLILAAHSGNSDVSYFKDLYKLDINDNIYIEYNGKQYEYKIVNYYIVEKTGFINIIRNKDKTTLTLITCVENTNKQLVIICEIYKINNL